MTRDRVTLRAFLKAILKNKGSYSHISYDLCCGVLENDSVQLGTEHHKVEDKNLKETEL
jgi:hypothetical protein